MYRNQPGGACASPILTLLEKIPQWEETLSSLNSTMDDRQTDLRAAEKYNVENASLKRCGSMETLRPAGDSGLDGGGEDSDLNIGDEAQTDGVPPPSLLRSSTSPGPIRYSTRLRKAQAAGESTADGKPPVLRKRKTESTTSMSATPRKKWNKKEIIVYYQAPVQAAFSSIFDSIKLVGHQLDKEIKARKETDATGRSSILGRHKYAIKSLSAYSPRTGSRAELGDLDTEMTLEADDNIDADFMLEVDPEANRDGTPRDGLGPKTVPDLETNGTTTPAPQINNLPDLESDTAPQQKSPAISTIKTDFDTDILVPDSPPPSAGLRSNRNTNPNVATTPYTRQLLARQSASKPASSAQQADDFSGPEKRGAEETNTNSDAPDIFTELSSNLNTASEIVRDAAHEFLKWGSCRLEIRKVEALMRKLKERAERGLREDPTLGAPASPTASSRGGALGRFGLSKYAAFANLGSLDADEDLGDLEADDLEVDDGMILEADDHHMDADKAFADLKVDSMHKLAVARSSIKSRKSTGSVRGDIKQPQYITVIKPDVAMTCSHDVKGDTTSQSTASADTLITPDELTTHDLRSHTEQRNVDLMAKYGVQTRTEKSVDVREVQISPLSSVN